MKNKLSTAQLKNIFEHAHSQTNPFAHLQDLSIFELNPDNIPKTREETGAYEDNETYWETITIDSFNHHVNRYHPDFNRSLHNNTLIIAETGHGITIAQEMRKHLGSDIILSTPAHNFDEHAQERLCSQAQQYRQALFSPAQDNPSTIIILDCHNEHQSPDAHIDPEQLPTLAELKEYGFTKILFLFERKPYSNSLPFEKASWLPSLSKWVENIQAEQEHLPIERKIKILMDGFDTRPTAHFGFYAEEQLIDCTKDGTRPKISNQKPLINFDSNLRSHDFSINPKPAILNFYNTKKPHMM